MSRNRNTGGSRKMKTATIKPIRPTDYQFQDATSLQKFLNYASSTEKTDTPELERLRNLVKHHNAASERK